MQKKLLANGRALKDWEKLVLENDLLDLDKWVHEAISGKISNCYKRFRKEWEPKLLKLDESLQNMTVKDLNELLGDPEKFVAKVCALSCYKNRCKKEEELEEMLKKKGK